MKRQSLPQPVRVAVFTRDGWRCKKCGFHAPPPTAIGLEVNHILGVADGGGDELENLDTLCGVCHAELSWVWRNQPPIPYAAWLRISSAASIVQLLILAEHVDMGWKTPADVIAALLGRRP